MAVRECWTLSPPAWTLLRTFMPVALWLMSEPPAFAFVFVFIVVLPF